MKRIVEIIPHTDTAYDSLWIDAGESWSETLGHVEQILDDQYLTKEWGEIKATIQCRTVTDEEYDEADMFREAE